MLPNEVGILQDALDYLQTALTGEGVYVAPESQDTEAIFPCVLVSVKTAPAVQGINEILLSTITVQCTIFADTVYSVEDGPVGVMSILDEIHSLMEAKHYRPSNDMKPSFHEPTGKWYKSIWYTKKSNTF